MKPVLHPASACGKRASARGRRARNSNNCGRAFRGKSPIRKCDFKTPNRRSHKLRPSSRSCGLPLSQKTARGSRLKDRLSWLRQVFEAGSHFAIRPKSCSLRSGKPWRRAGSFRECLLPPVADIRQGAVLQAATCDPSSRMIPPANFKADKAYRPLPPIASRSHRVAAIAAFRGLPRACAR